MSSESQPITPARFAAAIKDLPLSSLHSKAAELRNSITHLKSSNEQLMPFSEAGDLECSEAILENADVIRRMEERIELLKAEVEGRGMRWVEAEGKPETGEMPIAEEQYNHVPPVSERAMNGQARTTTPNDIGRGDADAPAEAEQDGVHL